MLALEDAITRFCNTSATTQNVVIYHAFENQVMFYLLSKNKLESLLCLPMDEQTLASGIDLFDIIHPEDRDLFVSLQKKELKEESFTLLFRLLTTDKNFVIVQGYFHKLSDAQAQSHCVYALDIFDVRTLYEASHESDTMKINFQAMMEHTEDFIFFKNINHVMTAASDSLARITGYEKGSDLVGKIDYELFPKEHADLYYKLEKEILSGDIPSIEEVQGFLDENREEGWVANRKTPIKKDGKIVGLFGIARVVTQEEKSKQLIRKQNELLKKAEEEDKELNEKLQKFIDAQSSIVILTDGKKIKFANKAFLEFLGCRELDDFLKEHSCICERFEADDAFFHLGKLPSEESNWITFMLSLSGRQRVVAIKDKNKIRHVHTVLINEFDNQSYVITFSDISDNILEKLELEQQATKDQLTGAYNRVYFHNNIERLLAQHRKYNVLTGLFFVDIDHFKEVNDKYGHGVGDSVLREVVKLMQTYTRDDDKVIRWGGEEFVLITQAINIKGVLKQAEHLRSIIEKHHFETVGHITCSFGCSLYSHKDNERIIDAIDRADKALYVAKNEGRNRVREES